MKLKSGKWKVLGLSWDGLRAFAFKAQISPLAENRRSGMKMRKRIGNIINGRRLRLLVCGVLLAAVTWVTAACGKEEQPSDGDKTEAAGLHHVEITIKDYGSISVELDGDTAPVTVGNFLKLAEDGFYDGLTFHRIINGFMMQGGDPLGTGMGGAEENIAGEFSENGVENNLSHTRGAISMARSNSFNSASSQFFIVHKDSTFLDGKYACFGYVTEGMDVVDSICESVPIIEGSDGMVEAGNQPVIESVKVID